MQWINGQKVKDYKITSMNVCLLTGFFSVVADDSGVSDGIQKLGSSLSRPPTMLDTLDDPAAC